MPGGYLHPNFRDEVKACELLAKYRTRSKAVFDMPSWPDLPCNLGDKKMARYQVYSGKQGDGKSGYIHVRNLFYLFLLSHHLKRTYA